MPQHGPEQTRRASQEYQEHNDELEGKPVGGWKETWQEKLIHTPSFSQGAKHIQRGTSRDTVQRPKASGLLQSWVRKHGSSGTGGGFRRQTEKPQAQRWTDYHTRGLKQMEDAENWMENDNDWRNQRLQSAPIQPQFYPTQGLRVHKTSELKKDANGLKMAHRDQAMAANGLGMAPRNLEGKNNISRSKAFSRIRPGMAPRKQKDLTLHTLQGMAPKTSDQLKVDKVSSDLQAKAANLKVDKVFSDLQGMALRNLKMDRVSLNFSEHQGSAEKPVYLRLQENIQWWEKHAPAATTNLI